MRTLNNWGEAEGTALEIKEFLDLAEIWSGEDLINCRMTTSLKLKEKFDNLSVRGENLLVGIKSFVTACAHPEPLWILPQVHSNLGLATNFASYLWEIKGCEIPDYKSNGIEQNYEYINQSKSILELAGFGDILENSDLAAAVPK